MAKKKKVVTNTLAPGVQDQMIKNSAYSDFCGNGPGSPFLTTQLSQANTLFKNNRWYLVSNFRQLLSGIYVEHGVIQTIIDVPVDDGLRGGVEIKSKQLSPEDIEELQIFIERENVLSWGVSQAAKWTRLFGGGGVVICTDQDPATPLNMEAIDETTPLFFKPFDMWEIANDLQKMEGITPETSVSESEYYWYYGIKIHSSRVLIMKGRQAPSFIRPRLRGWGYSVIEALVRSVNQYLKANDLSFEVLDEYKIDIFKIKGMNANLMSEEGMKAAQRRVQLANMQKNYQNALTMDADDDMIQKQMSFTGIAEIMKEIRMQVACDLRMPIAKIFGVSSVGFGSGQDDIENYNGMVESDIRQKVKFDILRILEICCQKLFGFVPDDLSIAFKPLRVLSAVDEETVKTSKFDRMLRAKQAGEMTTKEFKDGCNKDGLLSIQLDTSIETLTPTGGEGDEGEVALPKEGSSKKTKAKDAPEADT